MIVAKGLNSGLFRSGTIFSLCPSPNSLFLFFCQDYNPENSALLSSARNSPQDLVSKSILLTRFDFETTFAPCSASLGSVINHQEWFAPETNLAGEVTRLEGNQGFHTFAEFLLGSTQGQSQPVWNLIGKLSFPFGKGQLLWKQISVISDWWWGHGLLFTS